MGASSGILLPKDSAYPAYRSVPVGWPPKVDTLLHRFPHIGPHSLRRAPALRSRHARLDQEHQLFFDIFVGGDDLDSTLLQVPVPAQDLSRIAPEAIEELDHDGIGSAPSDELHHSEIFLAIVAPTRHDIGEEPHRGQALALAILSVAGLLGLQ